MLPTIYQIKSKVQGKMGKFRVYLSGTLSSINCAQAISTYFFFSELIKVLR